MKIIKTLLTIILIIGLIIAYGLLIEPKQIKVDETKITITNLTDNFNGFKIVHISDLHYGLTFDKESLKKLVKSINEQKPDIVVLTGDLLDKSVNMTADLSEEISKYLNKINATSGKYAISGEDDLKEDEWLNIIQNGGFQDLNNTYDTIYKNGYTDIVIAGASSKSDKESINDKLKTTIDYLNSFEKDGPIYTVLLVHEADVIDELTTNPFNLILAGHNHGGVVNGLIKKDGSKTYYKNYYQLDSSELYISNGLGGEVFRLFNSPSYNLYRLTNE